jgi:hypothetical protein
LVLTLVAFPLPVAHPAAAAGPFFGMDAAELPTARDFQGMQKAHVSQVRFLMDWPSIQPDPSKRLDWSAFDPVVAGAAEAGMDVLPVLYGTPRWAVDCGLNAPGGCETISPLRSDLGTAGWKAFVTEAVKRYGPNGIFWSDPTDQFNPPYRPIRRWQIWNEANSADFFGPRPSAGAYGQLVTFTSNVIKSVDPAATIYLAGVFGTPPKPGISAWKFLDRLYAIKGFKNRFDEVALHPYSPGVRGILYQLDRTRKVMRQNKDGGTPIAVTELGWSSGQVGGGTLFKGLAGQAAALKSGFNAVIKNRKRYKIDSLFWFSWRDPTPGTIGICKFCAGTGLLTNDYDPKPSLGAFTSFTGGS